MILTELEDSYHKDLQPHLDLHPPATFLNENCFYLLSK